MLLSKSWMVSWLRCWTNWKSFRQAISKLFNVYMKSHTNRFIPCYYFWSWILCSVAVSVRLLKGTWHRISKCTTCLEWVSCILYTESDKHWSINRVGNTAFTLGTAGMGCVTSCKHGLLPGMVHYIHCSIVSVSQRLLQGLSSHFKILCKSFP